VVRGPQFEKRWSRVWISMLKYIKILISTPTCFDLTDHQQEVGLYLVKLNELFKKTLNLKS